MAAEPPPVALSRLAPLVRPITAFLSAESAGGIVLLISTAIALAWANSPWAHGYHHFWHASLTLGVAGWSKSISIERCVNDGLMAVFFLLVGLEIKRELLIGELASVQRAGLPVAAAIGGMAAPALIYAMCNPRGPGAGGWGVPMATDIAFAVGVLALVGRALPASVKVFVLAVAIVDDLGAVLVIALFYTSRLSVAALGIAFAFLMALFVLNALRVHRPLPYILLGIGMWGAMLASGIHAAVAGVLLAFNIPATRQIEEAPYIDGVRKLLRVFERDAEVVPSRITEHQSHALKAMEAASQAVQTPLARVEHALLKPVNFLIMPLFALANAGVDLRSGVNDAMRSPATWGILLGLLLGKPIGILAASWLAVKIRAAVLPAGMRWRQLIGVSILCGIGFTMSLFIANLAFAESDALLGAAKFGILLASVVAGLIGGVVIAMTKKSAITSDRG